ncbi:MAG: branched-chain amino acid ABC transporter permease [Deltaproteobacteria bacterium]|nr:branched-chain amino acid ABC transporter permease [Deltaproteobacteria bacterium]
MFSQLIVNSLVSGGLYATLGFGFSLILNAVKILPFFFGALGIISAYSLYWLLELGRFSFITCLLLSALVTICFTVSLNQFLFKVFRQKKASEFVMLVLGLAIGIFLENLLLMLFGPDVKTIPLPFENQNIQIFGAHVTFVQILIFAISLPLLVASVYLIYFTYLGIIVRSLIEEPQTAEILGVNKERAFF